MALPYAGDALSLHLRVADVNGTVYRNVVTAPAPEARVALFDDLAADPAAWQVAQRAVDAVASPLMRSAQPVIDRPFELAAWNAAIDWPFRSWQASRFSDGRHGVWYGADSVATTIAETTWHWQHTLLADAGFHHHAVIAHRTVYAVHCQSLLLDLRPATTHHPALCHPSDYDACQALGARLAREGHPGVVAPSVRCDGGENVALFTPAVLSAPREVERVVYRLEGGTVRVERGG